ncbi:prepilin peptidase [Campylobacter mucosalis]|uniref:Peptidase A24 N-terminal domain protein, putative prepilin signal peptidase n=1 Tax=Campylobacter mucosalis CCUG 21559 TaxID=1032067 RepID=A0A6G5QH52_9BACT|nr:A24 family peptidase [Campylobacter mucosalis]QCD45008.1 peptidase A24 N-terminal domain protein, putative prepilin signal peptidase [Campylobacter mucosalis CCUG 21559]
MDSFELFVVVFGVCIGSFSNVLIYRLPRNQSVIFPASHCTSCDTPLKFYHNVPIFSWIFLGGKCAFCNLKISPIYPFIEIFSGILMLLAYIFSPQNSEILGLISSILLGICFIMLLTLSVIDIFYKAVPNVLLNVSVALSLAYGVILNLLNNEPFYHNALAGIAFALAFWLLRFVVSFFMKKEAMGSADIFIAGIIGAVLGYKLGLFAVYLGAVLTLPVYAVVAKRGYELPFVPFLSSGLVATYIFKQQAINFIGFLYE